MVFYWSLSDSKATCLLSILTEIKNAVVWMVSGHPLISKSSSTSTNHLVTVPSVLFTINITFPLCSIVFFSSLARSLYLSLFSLPFSFILRSAGTAKSSIRQVPFFVVDYHDLVKILWFFLLLWEIFLHRL